MSKCVNTHVQSRSISLKFNFFILICIFVRPDWLLMRVSFNKSQQNEEAFFPETFMARACFPNVSQFSIWETLFPVSSFCFTGCRLYLRYTAGNFNKNSSMRALAKILRARPSEHSSNFCEQFEQRQNFASTFKLDGTILYPF